MLQQAYKSFLANNNQLISLHKTTRACLLRYVLHLPFCIDTPQMRYDSTNYPACKCLIALNRYDAER